MNREGGGQDRGQVRVATDFLNRLQPRGLNLAYLREPKADKAGTKWFFMWEFDKQWNKFQDSKAQVVLFFEPLNTFDFYY